MKIDFKKLAAQALRVVAPIAVGVAIQKVTTGKVDVKEAVRKAIIDRLAA